jgi:hypothetical protein
VAACDSQQALFRAGEGLFFASYRLRERSAILVRISANNA